MNAVIEALDIRMLTESYLEDGIVQPGEMAERALREFDSEQLREVFEKALSSAFREEIRHRRKSLFRNGRPNPKLETAKIAYRLFIQPVDIGGEEKALGDCTIKDICAAKEAHRRRKESSAREEERHAALEKLMRRKKVELVRDLDAADVLEALSS